MDLYHAPLSCSFAVRVAAREASIDLALHQVEVFAKTLTATGADYLAIAPTGLVPTLRLDDGAILTEVTAILAYLEDLRPDAADRYPLLQWLSFVATELHKRVLWPLFNRDVPDAVRAHARESAARALDHLARRLADRDHLVGDRFTTADAYAFWALHLARLAGLDPHTRPPLAAYHRRHRERASIAALLAEETPLATAALARQA
jgi:glutathione S-transferase